MRILGGTGTELKTSHPGLHLPAAGFLTRVLAIDSSAGNLLDRIPWQTSQARRTQLGAVPRL